MSYTYVLYSVFVPILTYQEPYVATNITESLLRKVVVRWHDPYGTYCIRKNGRPFPVQGPCTKKVIKYVE